MVEYRKSTRLEVRQKHTDRGQGGKTELSVIRSPVEQTLHILKYLPGFQDNGHSSSPSILTFGFSYVENVSLMNEAIRFKSNYWLSFSLFVFLLVFFSFSLKHVFESM